MTTPENSSRWSGWRKRLPAKPKSPALYPVLVLAAGLVGLNLVLLAIVIKVNPRVVGDVATGALYLAGLLVVANLSDRVRRLERPRRSAGGFTDLVADAKAAAKLAGSTEVQAQAIAKEVLTTCVRKAGGWQP